MTNSYKKAISEKIKESLNNWIDKLKLEHKELLLTKQWQIQFPKGFSAGHNVLNVVTGSKKGKHLVAEVQFVLPSDLELDFDDLELILKNEPFREAKARSKVKHTPQPIDEPLEQLNDLVLGVNSFLTSLNINLPSATQIKGFNPINNQRSVLNVKPLFSKDQQIIPVEAINHLNGVHDLGDNNLIERVKDEMLKSPHLPQWLKTIESRDTWHSLMQKLAEGFIHYQKNVGKAVDLKEFFDKYEEHLLDNDKLYHFCKYKSKPVELDTNGWCNETYCSKMPYHSKCSYATLKFGTNPL